MRLKSFKYFLVAAFSVILVSFGGVVVAQEPAQEAHAPVENYDPAKVIIEHVKDGYEFHFFNIGDFHATIHLPVILYSPEKGFSIFSSSRFGHNGDEVYEGYKLEEGVIVSTDGSKVYDFSLTRNVVQMFIALTIFVLLMISIARKYKSGQGVTSAPKGWQNALEPVITFIRDDVAKPSLGKSWPKYFPYLLTLFFFILINSIFGMIPGSANVTGNTAFTLVLGVISLIVIVFSTNTHFWSHIVWPPGIPFLVKLILVPVELAGVFLIKPGALIIRLFANMIAGHIIIMSFISLIFIFGEMSKIAGWSFSPVSIIFTAFIYLVEIIVIFVQAYLFTILTAVFIGQSLEGGHDDEDSNGNELIPTM